MVEKGDVFKEDELIEGEERADDNEVVDELKKAEKADESGFGVVIFG
jgi:hypothetical protein